MVCSVFSPSLSVPQEHLFGYFWVKNWYFTILFHCFVFSYSFIVVTGGPLVLITMKNISPVGNGCTTTLTSSSMKRNRIYDFEQFTPLQSIKLSLNNSISREGNLLCFLQHAEKAILVWDNFLSNLLDCNLTYCALNRMYFNDCVWKLCIS